MMADNKQSFESAIKALEKIVEQLESGSLTLEESLKLYEEGVKLSTFCDKELKSAKLRITELKDEENSDE